MTSLCSSVCKCLPSFRSHRKARQSLPPDVHSEPSPHDPNLPTR
uniref:Uncharacterized protein n=1 Tax=Anopheles christyi TaxID=43041 RepID=A0A182KI48_9DIPT